MTPAAVARGPSLCWHCLNRLVYAKGGGFRFALVEQAGVAHRVHLDCVERVVGDGVRLKPLDI